MDFSRIEAWIQAEDDELLYMPDGEAASQASPDVGLGRSSFDIDTPHITHLRQQMEAAVATEALPDDYMETVRIRFIARE